MKAVKYKTLGWAEKRKVREAYTEFQKGLCQHCGKPLNEEALWSQKINKNLFPPSFFDYPVHLHHSHATGLTIGAVHNYCNAVLWQYHGE